MSDTGGVLARGWVAVVLKHALVSGLACWALWVQLVYRIPSELVFAFLPWVGAATIALSLAMLVNHVLDAVARTGPLRQALRRLEWWVGLVVRAFIYGSLVLFANAKLDRGDRTDRPAEVRAIGAVRPVPGGLVPYGWITLQLRDDGARPIRLVLRPDERDRFWVGEAVALEQGRGRLGIPWVAGIVPDRERRNRSILQVAPHASRAWQDLVAYYRERGRFDDAVAAALRYLAIYPSDRAFALQLADDLDVAGRPAEGVRLLEPLVKHAPGADLAKAYGLALARSGRQAEGARWLQEAAAVDVSDFWAYYHLGHVLRDLGRVPEGIAAYERALVLKPGFPEIEMELSLLRKALVRKAP
jgi:tetratricopeptide (TPR) repeat protein